MAMVESQLDHHDINTELSLYFPDDMLIHT